MNWADSATAFVRSVLAQAEREKPGDKEHALRALRGSTEAWSIHYEYADSRAGMKALGAARSAARAAIARGDDKPTFPIERPCRTCGAKAYQVCVPIGGEIKDGGLHAARSVP